MRLAVMLVLLSVSLTACGHSDYDDFMRGQSGGYFGPLALLGIGVFGFLFVVGNRTRHSKWLDAVLSGAFILCLGAGLGYVDDPEGWLEITSPTTIGSVAR